MAESNFLSRADLLQGRLSTERKGARVLGTIEARVSHMRSETRLAVQALFSGREDEFKRTFGDDYLRSLKLGAQFAEAPALRDIERLSGTWRQLVPAEADTRAALITLIGATRSRPRPRRSRSTLPDSTTRLRTAYQQLFRTAVEIAFPSRRPSRRRRTTNHRPTQWPRRCARGGFNDERPARPAHPRRRSAHYLFHHQRQARFTTGAAPTSASADLGRGLVGEIGVLTGEQRTASATAMRDSEVVRLPRPKCCGWRTGRHRCCSA
jgi:hypothetical protein